MSASLELFHVDTLQLATLTLKLATCNLQLSTFNSSRVQAAAVA